MLVSPAPWWQRPLSPRERTAGRALQGASPVSSLLGAGEAACAVPAATGSAPLLARWPQGPADVAPAACGQETPVYIPAVLTSSWSLIKGASRRAGRLGPLFLFHCIRFHIGPSPTWIGSSSTSARSYFHVAAGGTRSANPAGWVPRPCCQQQPCSLFPALPGSRGPAESSWISSFTSSHGRDEEQPTPHTPAHLLPMGGRGTAARTRPVIKTHHFLAPKVHLSWPFIPQPERCVSKSGKSVKTGLQIHSKTRLLLLTMV